MRKIIIIIVGIIIVCGIGGFVINFRNKETEVNKLLASNKISPGEEGLKNVKSDNEKNINTNISEETSNQQSIHIKNTKPIANQKDVQKGENVKVINNQNINRSVKQSNQENNDIKHSNNSTSSKYQISGRALDNLINNLYNSSWYQIRAIDKSFDKNGTEGGQLFDLIQFCVTPTIIKQTYGTDNLSKLNLKAVIVKTHQPSNNILWINIGGVAPKLEGYYDEIKPI
ncbi:hypothetical protein [Clostridium thermobutyricum]|uniref:Uncharacterized protein n=1 Tax=Clostridium thermobutyricum DSM 4928 TaxID=1121339 RepID=A0A1V4SRZ9_9CLOT|nr:hypothetical protein [Clostridium thermobutyricum]OPX46668.1 hypothetical protein CLTHE_26710 [Clostridium thermobutyricum DSM 4928]